MIARHKKKYFKLVFLFWFSVSGCSSLSTKTQVAFDNEDFIVEKKYLELLDHAHMKLKVYVNLDAQEAEDRIIGLQRGQLEYFEPNIEPYSGKNTVPEKCRIDRLPKSTKTENRREISYRLNIFSSIYFQLGCNTQEPVFAQSLFLYCRGTKKLFSIFTLLPKNKTWLDEPILHCP